MTLEELRAKIAGGAGKALSTITTGLWGTSGPQVVPGGLGASLQNWASPQNQANKLPLVANTTPQNAYKDFAINPLKSDNLPIGPNKPPATPVVSPAPTGGGAVKGMATAVPADTTGTGENLALTEWLSKLAGAKEIASNTVNTARSTFKNLMDYVNAFRNRAGTLAQNAGQEIVNKFGEITGQNARTGQELAGEARAKGRAMGLGDSSKFNLQNKVTSGLAADQGAAMASKGENERANDALLQERMDQAQNSESQATTNLNDVLTNANTIQNLSTENAGFDLGTALDTLLNRQQTLESLTAPSAGSLTPYSTNTSGITNVLNSVMGGLGATAPSTTDMAVNLSNPTTLTDILKKIQGIYTQ